MTQSSGMWPKEICEECEAASGIQQRFQSCCCLLRIDLAFEASDQLANKPLELALLAAAHFLSHIGVLIYKFSCHVAKGFRVYVTEGKILFVDYFLNSPRVALEGLNENGLG